MAWRVWGEWYATADAATTKNFQPVRFPSNQILVGMQTWVIWYNNPSFTSLSMRIYGDRSGSPGKLYAQSSNVQLKTALPGTLLNRVIQTWFDFPNVPVREDTQYHWVLQIAGYTGTAASHIAWMHGFPRPIYQPVGFGGQHFIAAPFQTAFISGEM